jgi:hypothetical protein
MTKKYYFIVDYNTKYGVIEKGQSLTGRLSTASKTPKVMFDFYEITDPVKAESGEGTFSINEVDLKNFATDKPTKRSDETKDEQEDDSKSKKGFKNWSTTKKTIVIGSSVVVLGLSIWYFLIRKK